ncbi:type-F conjugative transfer system protein TraW [Burkholderia stagnalis]|uniref:Type-F conjugative transfer system protein TraW n=1 Tax=Burkholderia stagnalis TaxID=1503054 RepID=A0ABX9YDC5_9BURK|nr:type-F conjugative transfer system protein TraW [Burkholderia stagnalis]RQQ48679.1 type-F conjugative transfer system protein TraW [Burkholderia stagnalis]RQQ60096.1 type-F conjugative transfer system protein TraW [Burkholderia stagnalis]RQQ60387.1 type-F conjugative transfer system protein TraW [Burkholderia stagnalis]RQQ75432.1 type-F conjugative transfer system protein TraW [Burkholderia stagnalis]RQQ80542.1 type-F conjugative transfer system protein TraW [Burkholderia stagnalis]
MKSSERIIAWQCALVLAAASVNTACAGMLGTVGPTYPIAEQSAVDQILAQLRKKAQTGELARLKQEAVQRSLNSARNPAPVDGIRAATARSEQLIDPAVTYAEPVRTDDGRIVIPAGTKVNPLDIMPFTETLVFFDGRDPEQAAAVARLLARPNARVKPVLIAGSWLDLTKQFKTQVYFDQNGTLSQRFGISEVPALIRQQGKALLLSVVPARELN